MKWERLLGLVMLTHMLLFSIVGCQQTTDSTPQGKPFYSIDLQDGFRHDSVQVKLDNRVIYDDTASTSIGLSLARRLTPGISSGEHQIQVLLPVLRVQADTTVDFQDTLVVGVNLNRSSNLISFTVYHFQVMYR